MIRRHDRIFRNGLFLATLGEIYGLAFDNMVIADVSVIAMVTIFLLWEAVLASDRKAARKAKIAERRKMQQRKGVHVND